MVDVLKTTYGWPTTLKASHIMVLVGMETPASDLQSLTEFRAQIEGHMRSLQILKVTSEEILTCLCHSKLPSAMDTILKRANGDRWLTLELFRTGLREEINTLQTKNLAPQGQMQAGHSLAYSVVKTYKCKLCKEEGHNWGECPTYNTNQKRINRTKIMKLCLNCLSDKHFSGECDSKWLKPSFNCKGLHLTKLCYKDTKGLKPPNSKNKRQVQCVATAGT